MTQQLQVIIVPIVEVPAVGQTMTPLRITQEDRNNITKASNLLGWSNAQFMRTILHNAALAVLKELG